MFANFDYEQVAQFGQKPVDRLMGDARIVRNRAQDRGGHQQRPAHGRGCCAGRIARPLHLELRAREARVRLRPQGEVPAATAESKALSRELKRRGWRFTGPTTVYAFMQAMGLVNDHLDGCHVRAAVDAARERFKRP